MSGALAGVRDQIEGLPHPSESPGVIGHAHLKACFLQAAQSGKLHHAWLLCGPEGIGKATFAWAAARYLLDPEGGAPDQLERAPDRPIQRQISAGSAHGLSVLRMEVDEKINRLRHEIVIDQVRKLKARFRLSNPEAAYQIAIIDTGDELNANAANALLKILEEPSPKTIFFLISHLPGRLLAPIRSRCVTHRFFPLEPEEFDAVRARIGLEKTPILMALSAGAPGVAARLSQNGGVALYETILSLFDERGRVSRPTLSALSAAVSGRGNEDRFALFITLLQIFLARLARLMVTTEPANYLPKEAAVFARFEQSVEAAQSWAKLCSDLCARLTHGKSVNLDPASLIIDMAPALDKVATRWACR